MQRFVSQLVGASKLLSFACLLCSCAVPGAFWTDTPWQGPLILGDQRARVQQRCDLTQEFMAESTRCDHAFIDQTGNRVDVTTEVRDPIDEYLDRVPELAPYAARRRTESKGWESGKASPFRIYVLTISPVVVLAVPRANNQEDYDERYCTAKIYDRGCLPTSRLASSPYWYKGAPRVRAGSFWFSPALQGGSVAVPDNASEYTIEVGKERVLLRGDGMYWKVTREPVLTR